jgi:hypothetical protein
VTVVLPEDLYRTLEVVRRGRGLSQSQIVARALQLWLVREADRASEVPVPPDEFTDLTVAEESEEDWAGAASVLTDGAWE